MTTRPDNPILTAAREAYAAGLCVLPVAEDGTKRPDVRNWQAWTRDRPDKRQMRAWFAEQERSGLGIVCGKVSGNLECLEFDDTDVCRGFCETAAGTGLGSLLERIREGFEERSPSGGTHLFYRCDEIAGNTKLARRSKRSEEQKDGRDAVKVLAETRGEGGYVIVAPSNGRVHPTGRPYQLRSGGFASIVTISPEERHALFALAKSFDQMPSRQRSEPSTPDNGAGGDRPGDDFAARTPWAEILQPAGWRHLYDRGNTQYWQRPGKTEPGASGTVNHASSDLLYVFSSSTPFETERGYGKFSAYAVLNHGGDFVPAAKALAAQGYGKPATFGVGTDTKPADPSTVGCEALLVAHGLSALDVNIDRDVLGGRLRTLAVALQGSDRLRVALVRDALIVQLKAAKILSAAAIVDAALRIETATPDTHQGKPLLLADVDPWSDPVNGEAVLDEVVRTITRFIVLPTHGAVALALWILHTYLMDAWWISPLAVATSPTRRCGKTALLTVVTELAHRPLAASNISPAALFRAVEKYQPTLLLDEGETWLKANEELRGIVNAGHTRRTAMVIRTVGEEHDPATFSTWCPKFIALIGELPDTLMDRAIVIEMRRKTAGEHVERLRLDHLPNICDPLRRQMVRWARDHADGVTVFDPEVPTGLHDRAVDNWRPLLALSDALGGEWPTRARAAARSIAGVDLEDTLSVQLLWDVQEVFTEDVMSSAAIVAALVAMDDRPWATWSKQDKPLTTHGLARLLRQFHIVPAGSIRVGDKVQRSYRRATFEEAWARYPLQTATRNKTNIDGPELEKPDCYTNSPVTIAKTAVEPMNTRDCYGVAVENRGEEGCRPSCPADTRAGETEPSVVDDEPAGPLAATGTDGPAPEVPSNGDVEAGAEPAPVAEANEVLKL